MSNSYSVLLSELVSEFNLEFFYKSSDYEKIHVTVDEISRPGLHLAGFFDHYEPMRVYVCGTVETAYLQKLSSEERLIIFDHFLSYKIPALIIARGIEALPECLEMAKKHDITVLSTKDTTSYIVSNLITYLKSSLAPRVTMHGVFVEVYGEGILLLGDSGIGKSETAIELVKRGHRLVADDAVDIKRVSAKSLVGSAPEIIRYFIELRGIGVIDVRRIFGMGAVKPTEKVDLIIQLRKWEEGKAYDRMGLEQEYTDILGIKVPSLLVPVRPGRNLAVIIEVAAMNNRNKKMGHNAAQEFTEQMSKFFAKRDGE
jgi:HPr kinase/phosphorylase